MTYCVAIMVDNGMVFLSDSRTNAGVDNVSTYSKMHKFGRPGERQFVILSAGNLATTQGVIAHINRDISHESPINLLKVPHMTDAADYLGQLSLIQQEKLTGGGATYEASFIIGGQIGTGTPALYLIYPQGNYITTSGNTVYLQIGESKYGKPVLDRILAPDVSLETAALCALVSMDSTMRSNITVGPPIELTLYHRDSLTPGNHYVYEAGSEYLKELKKSWDRNLKDAFNRLPQVAWSTNWDNKSQEKAGY